MKKTNLIITFAITAILTSLVSCSKQDVTGTWELTIFEKDGIAQELCIASLTLENEDKVLKAFGNSGVNNYSGEIKLSGKKAKTVNEFVCTKMMGPEKALEFESLFLKAMNEISSMEANKKTGELIIKSKSAIMKFTRATLTNKKWTLSSSLEVNDKTPFIIFDKEGKLNGFTGLNIIQAKYETSDNDSLIITPEVATLVSGDEEISKVETDFLQNLYITNSYKLKGNQLILSDKDKNQLLTFELSR